MRNIFIVFLVVLMAAMLWLNVSKFSLVAKRSDYAVELAHLIGVNRALRAFAHEHGGTFPNVSPISNIPSLGQYKGVCLVVNVTQDWAKEDYPILYFGGARQGDLSRIVGAGIDTFVVNGETKRVAMFADGKTELIKEADFRKFWMNDGLAEPLGANESKR